ncbi:MAG TPA: hypothetical protein VHX86_09200 [Tepidisphaeraceae bacterium]|jgi:PHD/YefM family antitoxin component YafN of YafNO toxin-antitoxin module|nr:hypothetical protein [Tepidisphaeraceae bacterium]
MKSKEISVEEFSLEAGKFLGQAQHSPLVIRSRRGPRLILRAVSDEELIDELVASNPRFRASVRRARRNRAAGKGISLREIQNMI